MKKKLYVLVEIEVETKRRNNFSKDFGGVYMLPLAKTKILKQDLLDIRLDVFDYGHYSL